MTEPNRTTETDPDGGPVPASWPAPATPTVPGQSGGHVPATDSAVEALLERLGELPELPVVRHGEVYVRLHDDLLAALDEDVTGASGAGHPDGPPEAGRPPGRPGKPAGTTTEPEDATYEQA